MALNVAAIVSDVATRARIPDVQAAPFVDAAIEWIAQDSGVPAEELPESDVLLTQQGVPLLALRMLAATPALSRSTNEFDPAFGGLLDPLDVNSGLDQYWAHLRVNWGVA